MRQLFLTLALSVCTSVAMAQQVVSLYSVTIPNSKPSEVTETSETRPDGTTLVANVIQPTLTVFRPAAGAANGTAVIVCPGGGYAVLAMGHEGLDVARQLTALGVTAFVLKYRLPNDQSQPDKTIAPLLDAQQAIRLVRQRAAEFGVNPARIGLMGFSAGGHLAATAGTHFARPMGQDATNTSVRPDFLVLLYPVISFTDSLAHAGSRANLLGEKPTVAQVRLYSNELQVSPQTPPTFLMHAQDDKVVDVRNSLRFYEACRRRGVPAEMHLYAKGSHGFGLVNPSTKDSWLDRLQNWLAANGWLSK